MLWAIDESATIQIGAHVELRGITGEHQDKNGERGVVVGLKENRWRVRLNRTREIGQSPSEHLAVLKPQPIGPDEQQPESEGDITSASALERGPPPKREVPRADEPEKIWAHGYCDSAGNVILKYNEEKLPKGAVPYWRDTVTGHVQWHWPSVGTVVSESEAARRADELIAKKKAEASQAAAGADSSAAAAMEVDAPQAAAGTEGPAVAAEAETVVKENEQDAEAAPGPSNPAAPHYDDAGHCLDPETKEPRPRTYGSGDFESWRASQQRPAEGQGEPEPWKEVTSPSSCTSAKSEAEGATPADSNEGPLRAYRDEEVLGPEIFSSRSSCSYSSD